MVSTRLTWVACATLPMVVLWVRWWVDADGKSRDSRELAPNTCLLLVALVFGALGVCISSRNLEAPLLCVLPAYALAAMLPYVVRPDTWRSTHQFMPQFFVEVIRSFANR